MVMHMLQHILLLDIAPILLILGLTKVLLRPVTRRLNSGRAPGRLLRPSRLRGVRLRRGSCGSGTSPRCTTRALRYPNVHVLEHVCFAVAGTLYWWHLLSPIRSRMRLGGLGPIAYMVSTKLLVGLLGIVLAFAPDLALPVLPAPTALLGPEPDRGSVDGRAR